MLLESLTIPLNGNGTDNQISKLFLVQKNGVKRVLKFLADFG